MKSRAVADTSVTRAVSVRAGESSQANSSRYKLALPFVLVLSLLSLSPAARTQERGPRQLIVPLAEGGFVAFQAETAFSENNKTSAGQQSRAVFDSQALVDDKQVSHRLLVDTEGRA